MKVRVRIARVLTLCSERVPCIMTSVAVIVGVGGGGGGVGCPGLTAARGAVGMPGTMKRIKAHIRCK